MAELRIERHPAVTGEDLPDIYAFIAKDDAAAAGRVLDAIGGTFTLLAREPEAGMRYRTRSARLGGLRMIPVAGFRNYLVFYRVAGGSIRILYVAHGARNLARLFPEDRRD